MTAKTLWVTFISATPVPAAVLGEAKDRRMPIGVPVELPAAYGAQMVADRFAVNAEAPAAKKTAKNPAKKASAAGKATGAAAAEPRQQSLKVGTGATALSVADAQAAFDAIQAEMEALTEDQPRWQALQPQLDEAAETLAAAQDAV